MGNYINESLLTDEVILHKGHPHWSYVIKYYLICSALFIMAVVAFVAGRRYPYPVLDYVCIAILGIVVIIYIISYFIRTKSEYAITNTRLIQKNGIFDIHVMEIPLFKVETVNLSQSFWQRVIGTGDIELVGSGGSNLYLTYISNPSSVRNTIMKALNNLPNDKN